MNSNHLTSTNPDLEKLVRKTEEGMAHWSGTGPRDTTCGQCIFWGYYQDADHYPARCEKFFKLTGKHGKKPINVNKPSCRHYEGRPQRKGGKSGR